MQLSFVFYEENMLADPTAGEYMLYDLTAFSALGEAGLSSCNSKC